MKLKLDQTRKSQIAKIVVDSCTSGGVATIEFDSLPEAHHALQEAQQLASRMGLIVSTTSSEGNYTIRASYPGSESTGWVLTIKWPYPRNVVHYSTREAKVRNYRYIIVKCGKKNTMLAPRDMGTTIATHMYAAQMAAIKWGTPRYFLAWYIDSRQNICFVAAESEQVPGEMHTPTPTENVTIQEGVCA